jgi:hypothetical protein
MSSDEPHNTKYKKAERSYILYIATKGKKADCRQKLSNKREMTIANSQNFHFVRNQRIHIQEERM